MSSKTKRFCVSFTQEDIKELEFLSNQLGESKNQILRRALILLHHTMTNNIKDVDIMAGVCRE